MARATPSNPCEARYAVLGVLKKRLGGRTVLIRCLRGGRGVTRLGCHRHTARFEPSPNGALRSGATNVAVEDALTARLLQGVTLQLEVLNECADARVTDDHGLSQKISIARFMLQQATSLITMTPKGSML